MKAVLISIQPKWCKLIAEGKKTVEVRKTKPKLDVPFKCYIYCTQGKEMLWILNQSERAFHEKIASIITAKDVGGATKANGKVIGEFVCDEIYHIKNYDTRFLINNDERLTNGVARASCLNFDDMKNYLKDKDGYAWHITDLVIYNKPKELFEFFKYDKYQVCKEKGCFSDDCWICPNNAIVTRPPQSYMFVEMGV